MASNIETKKTWAMIVNPDAGSEVVAVIDIYRESPKKEQEPEINRNQKSFKSEVDPVGFKIAQDFYEKCGAQITTTTRRNDLEKIFTAWNPHSEREFPIVLYALAKGMKVVNVFDRGAALEWHKCHTANINKTKRAMKKPHQGADGWTNIGPPEDKKDEPLDEKEFTPKVHQAEVSETIPVTLSMDEIVQKISQTKSEINDLDSEIQSLLAFHREHLREIDRVESIQDKQLGVYLKKFHERMVTELEKVLDSIQAEINSKKEIQSHYCDMLKQ